MEIWHKKNIDKLVSRIVDQFVYLYGKYNKNNELVYGVAINTNEFCTTSFMSVAIYNQLEIKSINLNWQFDDWIITVDDGIYADDFLDQFNKDIREYFGEIMLPKIQNGSDELIEIEKNVEFYIQALKESKLIIMSKINENLNDVIFILNVKEHKKFSQISAKVVNIESSMLDNFIKSIE